MKKALLIASTGGHLAQLARIAPQLGVAEDSLWVTFKNPQSESLLDGQRTAFVPYIKPRDWFGTLKLTKTIHRILREEKFDIAISTGAAPAVAALPLARLHGVEARYIESVSRVNGPSLSGRILASLRVADLFTQHEGRADGRWSLRESVFSAYERYEIDRPETTNPRLFVTLGTIEGFRFDSMVDAVLATGLADENTVWQLGSTPRTDELPGTVFGEMPAAEFQKQALAADVVVSHAGVGSLLGLLDIGKFPILAIRRRERREHVDDHQAQIASLADREEIALAAETQEISRAMILEAAKFGTRPLPSAQLTP